MRTFCVQTLGCKVNHYESEQIAELLRSRGLIPVDKAAADLHVINTCSVTIQAASQSRQSVRRVIRLPLLTSSSITPANSTQAPAALAFPAMGAEGSSAPSHRRPRVIVMGCWATSNPTEAAAIPGVDAVLGHHQDVAAELERLLVLWKNDPHERPQADDSNPPEGPAQWFGNNNGWKPGGGTRVDRLTPHIEPKPTGAVNENIIHPIAIESSESHETGIADCKLPGTTSLPLLGKRQAGRQRAFLKIQDGCDAHCTYCIIPTLRPNLWSKPVESAVEEARALVGAGHVEIVLTGIFLGAYSQPTALRRRQPQPAAQALGNLIDALCTRVPGLRRLRLSSLEPGDLTADLLAVLRAHAQVVPHFHLPLQSGSDALLRRMNRQYTRHDFLEMVDRVNGAFDRPALTTDVVVGFPGETDQEFAPTADLVRAAGFIHVHAFPYSARPGTAAARWTKQFVRGPVVNQRIEQLTALATMQSEAFRRSFIGQTVELIVERDAENKAPTPNGAFTRHGRSERYFPVFFNSHSAQPGDVVCVKIREITGAGTFGETEGSAPRADVRIPLIFAP